MKLARLLRHGIVGLSLASALMATATPARAIIIEKIVAVVGDKPVLLSDLRRRARPRLIMVAMQQPDPARSAAGETQAFKDTLDDMINERLIEQAADKAHIGVSSEEIDRAMKQKADSLRMTQAALMAEAGREGFSEQDYRDEIRRQLLEGKMIQLRVQGRVRITEADARASYTRFVGELGEESPVELQAVALQLGATPQAAQARQALARQVVEQARAGADFCELVKKYSDDVQTRDTCGSRGLQPMKALFPVVRERLSKMEVGAVSDPIQIGDQAIVIFRLNKRQPIPSYSQIKDQMMERATGEAVDHQRKLWLDELRRGAFLDVRL